MYLFFIDPFYLVQRCTLYCSPAAAAGGLGVASAGAQVYAQRQQAKAAESFQKKLAKSNVSSARDQANQVRDQQAQGDEVDSRTVQQALLANRQAEATAVTAAGEAGVSGNSVVALLGEFQKQAGIYKEATLRQQQFGDVAANQQIDAIRRGADAGNLSMNAPINQPNYLAAALGAGAQAAGTYAAANPRTTSTTGFTGSGTYYAPGSRPLYTGPKLGG